MGKTVTRVPRSEGDWIYTASGRKFWPLDPRPDEIHIQDIAEHLSGICRWNGACSPKYSVAEHSVRVARAAEARLRGRCQTPERIRLVALAGLLHDASEAYLCDLVSPMKGSRALKRIYEGFEAGLMAAVWERFGLPEGLPLDVMWADQILRATEFRDLMRNCPEVPGSLRGIAPLPERIDEPLSPEQARDAFLAEYERIQRREERCS